MSDETAEDGPSGNVTFLRPELEERRFVPVAREDSLVAVPSGEGARGPYVHPGLMHVLEQHQAEVERESKKAADGFNGLNRAVERFGRTVVTMAQALTTATDAVEAYMATVEELQLRIGSLEEELDQAYASAEVPDL